MAGVTLRDVRKAFGPIQTIHGVDLDVGNEEFVVFVGPSGRRAAGSPRCCG